VTRRRSVLVALALLSGSALAAVALPAALRAGSQPALVVEPGTTVTRTYPALIGTFPQGPSPSPEPDPANCANLPSCDVIPLTVVQPEGVSVFDEFALEVELRWPQDTPVPDDLSLYLWYDPQTANSAGSSITDRNPEVVRFAEPTSGAFSIVVANVSGPNTGYTVVVRSIYRRGSPPAELNPPPPPTFGVGSTARGGASSSAPPAGAGPTSPPTPARIVAGPPLILPSGEVAPAPPPSLAAPAPGDPALAALDARAGDATAGGGDLFRRSAGSGRPAPISPPLFILWTVVAPLVVLVGAGLAFLRLRPKALTIDVG
jgi:hypothetical protein